MGDAAEGEGEEARVRVSAAGEMFEALLQKRDEDGEKTGELQTAIENDIVRKKNWNFC